MTDTNKGERRAKEVRVTWPQDTFANARPANRFSFTIHEGTGYFAFGQVVPIPFDTEPPDEIEVSVAGTVSVTVGMFASMRASLNQFANEHPEVFAEWQPADDESPSEQ